MHAASSFKADDGYMVGQKGRETERNELMTE
jgi:hypothetical protein